MWEGRTKNLSYAINQQDCAIELFGEMQCISAKEKHGRIYRRCDLHTSDVLSGHDQLP